MPPRRPSEDGIDVSDEAAADMQPPNRPTTGPTVIMSPNDPPEGSMSITPSAPTRVARQADVRNRVWPRPPRPSPPMRAVKPLNRKRPTAKLSVF